MEKEKLDAIEKKKKENEALVKAIKENDLKLKMKKKIKGKIIIWRKKQIIQKKKII